MGKKVELVLRGVLKNIEPPKEDLEKIKIYLNNFLRDLQKQISVLKLNAEIFVGGSFAKGTVAKKEHYDVDVFVRFDKKYSEEKISELTSKLLSKISKFNIVHGSRDYFGIEVGRDFCIEIIPVIKINKPEEALNVTDLSFSHVNYLKKKIKSKKILDEIKLAKVFCDANKCYGAESYIKGFSGYGLELLVIYYGGFVKFISAIVKAKDKVVIDMEKQYKNNQEIMMDLNESKLQSPIILIDPTYKQRNALSALSEETFGKFQKVCRDFLKNPSTEFFESQKVDLEKIQKEAEKKKHEFILFKLRTLRQEGDIAGSKLLKFYNHLIFEIERFFNVHKKGFSYNGKKEAKCFFVMSGKKEILFDGPLLSDVKNIKKFRKTHKNCFEKKGKLFARKKILFNGKDFLRMWKKKNNDKLNDMSISGFEVI